jgi:uncharacterized protein YodC (DUF2158 family)
MKMMFLSKRTMYRGGDVLTLKSGGRPITATWVGPVVFAPGTWLICQWFDNDGELRQVMFPETMLERVPKADAARSLSRPRRTPARCATVRRPQ